jgi:hypothetical protein
VHLSCNPSKMLTTNRWPAGISILANGAIFFLRRRRKQRKTQMAKGNRSSLLIRSQPRLTAPREFATSRVRDQPEDTFKFLLDDPWVQAAKLEQRSRSAPSEVPAPRYHLPDFGMGLALRGFVGKLSLMIRASIHRAGLTSNK